MYRVITEDYTVVSEHNTLVDAEVALCKLMDGDEEYYLQYPEDYQ